MIQVNYIGRLGNNLFQYCFGRILAQRLNYELKVDPIPGFPNTSSSLSGESYEGEDAHVLQGHQIDLEEIISHPPRLKIILNGFFQRYEYYKPYREIIKNNWLLLDKTVGRPDIKVDPEDLIIHVRLGDFFKHRAVLPFSWYREALISAQHRRLFIVTDEPGNPYLLRFKKYKPIILNSTRNPIEDFKFISRFDKIIQSQSSFSWWASFLSSAHEIIAPIPLEGYWSSQRNEIDLRVDEPRYHYLPCREVYKPSLVENVVNARRKIGQKSKRIFVKLSHRTQSETV